MTQIRVECLSVAAGQPARVNPGFSVLGWNWQPAAAPKPRFTYDLLREISFTVAAGERLAIVGASGAGKTTLLRSLNRLQEPRQGQLFFQGQPFDQIPILQLRQQVVFVPQEPNLLGMSVQQALAYPLKLRQLPPAVIQDRLADWQERLAIPDRWHDRSELQLSLGERQWVAIARALICQPQVLLLDEPTAALDVGRTQQLLNILMAASEHQQAILVATHQLEFAQQFCQRLLHLKQGSLVADQPGNRVDWQKLKDTIAQLEAESAAEWDE